MAHANPHHEPRHEGGVEDDDHETEVEHVKDGDDHTEVRHHIYMPYPLAYRYLSRVELIMS